MAQTSMISEDIWHLDYLWPSSNLVQTPARLKVAQSFKYPGVADSTDTCYERKGPE